MVQKYRISLALQPLATALFANSPFQEGKLSNYLSLRSNVWTDTDPYRCGMLPFVFDAGYGFERHVDYILDVPMYFVYRDGIYYDVAGKSFRDFMDGKLEGFEGELPHMGDFADKPIKKIRAAFIGLNRGGSHLRNFATIENTEVVALSDLYEENVKRELERLYQYNSNTNNVKTYWGDKNKWKVMLKEVRPDVVFISTNWNNHAPMAIQSMIDGAHAFVEVPMAVTLEEMWDIVNTSEKTQKHCMMMENVNYGRAELMYLNMCRQNIIGELLHGEAAYIHELRWQMMQEDKGTGSWRTLHYREENGNVYPTHGLGPIAQYMNLCRKDDNFKSLVSYSSPALGRKLYAEKNFPKDHKWNNMEFKNGDLNTSIIKTEI